MSNNLYEDSDFIELVIKHIIRDSNIYNLAKSYNVTPEDVGGIDIYRAFLKIALDLGEVPISINLFLLKIKEAYSAGLLNKNQEKQIIEFLYWIYNDQPLDSKYIEEHLPKMLKHRRMGAVLNTNNKDFDEIVKTLSVMAFEFDSVNESEDDNVFYPFVTPVFKTKQEAYGTGFLEIDAVASGLTIQEFGLIVGYSGSGKTAVAVHSALQNALNGVKVLYVSLEESSPNISNRLYANYFNLNYSDLHHVRNGAAAELQSKISSLKPEEIEILKNIRVAPLKDKAPVTVNFLKNYLDNLYQTEGYAPQLVYIDQMDYLEPSADCDASWEKYSKVAFEVDDLTNHLIGGEHPFSVWLLHQATGKMKRYFTNAEISGFKGIIKPADFVLGIGKDKPEDETVSLFSLKCRHSKNFTFDYFADLAHMRFGAMSKGGEARIKKEKEILNKRSSFNTPKQSPFIQPDLPKQPKLPPPTGDFN